MRLRIGELRHRVQIQRATETRQSNGGVTQSWATTATVWAAIEPITGREGWISEQVRSVATHKVTMRYTAITTAERLLFGTRVFSITAAVNVDEANHITQLAVTEAL